MTDAPDPKTQKRSARLMAVQGVYSMLSDQKSAEELIPAYLAHYAKMEIDDDVLESPDQEIFQNIMNGVEEHKLNLDKHIQKALGERQTPVSAGREPLLYAVLLCGVYELKNRHDIDVPIIISDYLHVTHAFFEGNEAKLVNAVLDQVSKSSAS
jgi:N utilization substance protein B